MPLKPLRKVKKDRSILKMLLCSPFLILELILLTSSSIESAKILGIFPVHSKSHIQIDEAIVKGLAARGHQVTVISHFKSNHFIANYTEILIPERLATHVDDFDIRNSSSYVGAARFIRVKASKELLFCDQVFELEFVQKLIENSKEKHVIDLIIAERSSTLCYNLLAYKLNVPLILVSPLSSVLGIDYHAGNLHNPSVTPAIMSEFTSKMSFWQRLENTFYYCLFHWYEINQQMERYARRVLDMTELPSDEELRKRTSLVFYNNHLSFSSRLRSPNVIDVAGIHIKEPRELPEDIKDFIDGSDHGVIFFSFGSSIKASTISNEKLKIIKEVFSSIPQRVLWRVDELNITKLPSNVKIGKWFPQQDILNHKKVIAFISHCGLLGLFEAIHTATPVIGIPFAYDQFQNAHILVEKKSGIYVDYFTMDKSILLNAINEITANTTYHRNMQRWSKIFKDRPISPLDEAMRWSEYVLRHRGAAHLRIQAADMPLRQYLMLDILVLVLVSVLGIAYLNKL